MLKLKQSENDSENSQLLQTMLEDANERKGELESQVRYAGLCWLLLLAIYLLVSYSGLIIANLRT